MTHSELPLPELPEDRFRASGAELEAALRAAGTPLPQEITGAQLLRAVLEEALRHLITTRPVDPAQHKHFGLAPIVGLVRALQAELPGGASNPAFANELLVKVRTWARTQVQTLNK